MTKVVLACLCVAFIAVAAIVFSLHASTPVSPGPARRAAPTAKASPAAVSHSVAATETIDADTTTTRAALDAIAGIPTPAKVAAVINPYVAALEHYGAVLTGTVVPADARTTASNLRSLVDQDVQSLSTIAGLAPLRLGSYLEQFGTNTRQLQIVLGNLEGELAPPTS